MALSSPIPSTPDPKAPVQCITRALALHAMAPLLVNLTASAYRISWVMPPGVLVVGQATTRARCRCRSCGAIETQ
jgi:hypothetical protein